ncbi:MAG: hypothetical protein K9I94_14945 [Bacteroidales bacterium]|nr:hypothetical protein [Bacteroidales bacterium]
MRELTEIEKRRIKILVDKSVDFALIEPTSTGLNKSIMDATTPVRTFLEKHEIHDYENQQQGQSYKKYVKSKFIESESITSSVASFYRPHTKKGDPRLWFKSLKRYAKPNDVIAVIAIESELYLIDISRLPLENLIQARDINPFSEVIEHIHDQKNSIANELLQKLKLLAIRGKIPSIVSGDTGVGRTLETELGIKMNSSKKPDYKGIELKSYRDSKINRKNLFGQVPDWELSKFKSSLEILMNFGYKRDNDIKLNCTVGTLKRNSQGLIFKIYDKKGLLVENSDKKSIGDFAVWSFSKLNKRLEEKHAETFWIKVEPIRVGNQEYFIYKEVEHTRKPIIPQFEVLLSQGIITMDHLMKQKQDGSFKEKGPLFKIKPNSLDLLFPPSIKYVLS